MYDNRILINTKMLEGAIQVCGVAIAPPSPGATKCLFIILIDF